MSNYQELKNQAEELLRQAEQLRAEERARVLAETKDAVAEWNFSANELGLKLGLVDKRAKAAAKYKDPVSGKTWSGRGKAPQWFSARLNEGVDKAELLVA
ncbi:MAG: hypothetical protein RL156_1778 [Bacteroidota bacterium]|jgi:DNA-binding protein H-NS